MTMKLVMVNDHCWIECSSLPCGTCFLRFLTILFTSITTNFYILLIIAKSVKINKSLFMLILTHALEYVLLITFIYNFGCGF